MDGVVAAGVPARADALPLALPPPPSDANVLNAPVAPYVIAFKPYDAVFGMIVTGSKRTFVNPARTFFLTWAGFADARNVGSEVAKSDAV